MSYLPIKLSGHSFDPASDEVPAPLVLSRVAQSSFLRESEHPIFYAEALLDHWARLGTRVLNGAEVLAIDSSKARQLSLIKSLGYGVPETRVVHRVGDLVGATEGMAFPVLVKANIGGSGAGMVRYESAEDLAMWADDGTTPVGLDGVALVQEYVPARDGRVIRCEVLDGRFLYAIALNGAGTTFDLCPADVCMEGKPTITIEAFTPPSEMIRAVEAISRAAGLDVGGIEYMIDDRDGAALFYDINALSNFVANPLDVLGWDPHVQFVEYLIGQIAARARVAA